jgi:hypothetical protein
LLHAILAVLDRIKRHHLLHVDWLRHITRQLLAYDL